MFLQLRKIEVRLNSNNKYGINIRVKSFISSNCISLGYRYLLLSARNAVGRGIPLQFSLYHLLLVMYSGLELFASSSRSPLPSSISSILNFIIMHWSLRPLKILGKIEIRHSNQ